MKIEKLKYSDTGKFSNTVLDYLSREERLTPFYNYAPSKANCLVHANKRRFSQANRSLLFEVLNEQYQGLAIDEAVQTNINALKAEHCFTVTTGHQIVLLTGPLFFPFKVLNAIRIARELTAEKQGKTFVPVLWMATEDHDRDEVDHVFIDGKKINWPGDKGGPVGRMPLNGISAFIEALNTRLGISTNAKTLLNLIREHYTETSSLAEATRGFCNALFGKFGLVILDADDARFKAVFAPIMLRELKEGITYGAVSKTAAALEKHYKVQVNPRHINLFYMENGIRERIESTEQGFMAGDMKWSTTAFYELLEKTPECFSPNVLLRPVYQECILPNVAYIGGGGELAYWLEMKAMFEAFDVDFPVLFVRTSAMFLSEKAMKRMDSAGIELLDLFTDKDKLKARKATEASTHNVSVAEEKAALRAMYSNLKQRVSEEGLHRAMDARAHRAQQDIEAIEKKLVRYAKRQQGDLMRQLDEAVDTALPNGKLQERSENFAMLYMAYGNEWSELLLDALNPFDEQFTVIS